MSAYPCKHRALAGPSGASRLWCVMAILQTSEVQGSGLEFTLRTDNQPSVRLCPINSCRLLGLWRLHHVYHPKSLVLACSSAAILPQRRR